MRGSGLVGKKCNSLLVVEGDVGEELSPLAVDGVGEAGVVGVQLVSVGQDLMSELVQVLLGPGEPRNGICRMANLFTSWSF